MACCAWGIFLGSFHVTKAWTQDAKWPPLTSFIWLTFKLYLLGFRVFKGLGFRVFFYPVQFCICSVLFDFSCSTCSANRTSFTLFCMFCCPSTNSNPTPLSLSLTQSFESTPTINTKGKVHLYLVGFGFFSQTRMLEIGMNSLERNQKLSPCFKKQGLGFRV